MTINAAFTQLLHELADDGLPDVLSTRFTFAALWGDLCRLAGEELPRDVAAVLDQPIGFVPVAVPVLRGAYAAQGAPLPTHMVRATDGREVAR